MRGELERDLRRQHALEMDARALDERLERGLVHTRQDDAEREVRGDELRPRRDRRTHRRERSIGAPVGEVPRVTRVALGVHQHLARDRRREACDVGGGIRERCGSLGAPKLAGDQRRVARPAIESRGEAARIEEAAEERGIDGEDDLRREKEARHRARRSSASYCSKVCRSVAM